MKIAMIGQKGIPAKHGGIERHVEELSTRLAARGESVTVYIRPGYVDDAPVCYKGVSMKSMPTFHTKHLEAIVHSFLATIHAGLVGADIVHLHADGPSLMAPLARLLGRKVVCTIHGQDWRRGKWGALARGVLRAGEWCALHVAHCAIVVSESLAEDFERRGARHVVYVPNGIALEVARAPEVFNDLNVRPGQYVLFVGRLVPEKGVHYLLEAYGMLAARLPLVVAGDTSHSDAYVEALKAGAGPEVRFVGYQYGGRLASLLEGASLLVLPSDLEGLPIVLLEALGHGVPVLASDIAPNVEILGDSGRYFRAGDPADLAVRLNECLADASAMKAAAVRARSDVLERYDWERIADETLQVYRTVSGIPRRGDRTAIA